MSRHGRNYPRACGADSGLKKTGKHTMIYGAVAASLARSAILILASIILVYHIVLTPDEKVTLGAFASRSHAALQPGVSKTA